MTDPEEILNDEALEEQRFLEQDECQLCGGEVGVMGRLGNMLHLMCRHCGMQFSRPLH